LVGSNGAIISDCYSTGSVSGAQAVAGLVAYNDGSISNCYSSVSVSGTGDFVGGLVGRNYQCISNSYSTGDVSGDYYIGGLVGYHDGHVGIDSLGQIINSYSTGDVSGDSCLGGLVGRNNDCISNCYATGEVNGIEYVGGLVGYNGSFSLGMMDSPGYIFNSYSTADVNGVDDVGALVGYNESGDIDRSFWDVETTVEPNMCGGQFAPATGCDPNCGKTTSEMNTRSTFTEAGWDFVEIWLINQGATYPVLRQEIRSDLNGNGGVNMPDFAIFADHSLEGTAD